MELKSDEPNGDSVLPVLLMLPRPKELKNSPVLLFSQEFPNLLIVDPLLEIKEEDPKGEIVSPLEDILLMAWNKDGVLSIATGFILFPFFNAV